MDENPFLQGLAPEQHELLSALFVSVSLQRDQVVFREGDAAEFMYLLLDGSVSIRYTPYDGPRMTLTALHVGDVFGWSSVVGNDTYTSDAVATTDARALRVRGADIRKFCLQHPSTGALILDKLAHVVAPRWLDSRAQVQHLLQQGILESEDRPQSEFKL